MSIFTTHIKEQFAALDVAEARDLRAHLDAMIGDPAPQTTLDEIRAYLDRREFNADSHDHLLAILTQGASAPATNPTNDELVAVAADAQNAYWDALAALERALGCEIDTCDLGELDGYTAQELIELFGDTEEPTDDTEEPTDDTEEPTGNTVHHSVTEMMAETGCDYMTAAVAHNID